ncbi:Fanconi anemia group I protein homolog [Saccoglossus kowalevskii]
MPGAIQRQSGFVEIYVNVALQKIQQIHDRGHCEGMQGKNQDKIYKYTTTLARVLLRKYSTDAYSPDERASKDRRLIMNIVNSGEDEDVTTKDAVPLCNIISLLSKYLICTGTQFVQLHSWVSKLCQEQNLDDSSLTKAFINLLFLLTSQSNSNITITRDIGQDIHSQVGDMDQDVEVEDKTHYAIINPRTFAPVLTILHVQVEKYIDEAEWVLGVMKNEAISSNLGSPGCTQKESLEKAVCTRLGILVTSFHELVQSALPVGMAVDTVIKMVTRLYGTLSILTKYYISLYNQHNGHLSTRFEKLVKLIGTHLTQQCYAMINYIQLSQNDEHNHSIADASKNTKGKKKQATAVASTSNGKSKLLKEARSIPNLIYSIEQYEKFLIQLSKKSKVSFLL